MKRTMTPMMPLTLLLGVLLAACTTAPAPLPATPLTPVALPDPPTPPVTGAAVPAPATVTVTAVVPPTVAPDAAGADPTTAPSGVPYYNAEAGFSLLLPPDWQVAGPETGSDDPDRPYTLYLLGPDPSFSGDPGVSRIFVADARQWNGAAFVQAQCGSCPDLPLEEVTLGSLQALRATVGLPGLPFNLTWHFVTRGEHFVALAIHDPETLDPLDDVLQSLRFDAVAGGGATDPLPAVPQRVQFAPGAISATVQGEVAPGTADRYVLGAMAGQEMTLLLDAVPAGEARLRVDTPDGQRIVDGVPDAPFLLPASGDYIVTVSGGQGAAVSYDLKLTVSALAPQVPPLDELGYADRPAWVSFLGVPTDCEDAFQRDAAFYQQQDLSGITIFALPAERYLLQVHCETFAYSTQSRLHLFDAVTEQVTALTVPEYDVEQGQLVERDILWGSDFIYDPATLQTRNFQKWRGVGDCGMRNSYRVASDRLVLVEARQRDCVDGAEYVPPAEWPVVYASGSS